MSLPERWLPISGFGGAYEVSDHGRVRSKDRIANGRRIKGQLLSSFPDRDCYPRVNLSHNNKAKARPVHRLVAECFLERGDGQTEVNHKNGDRADARAENLEWCTRSQNEVHAFRVLGKKGPQPPKPVIAVDGDCVLRFDSVDEAARRCGLIPTAIINCLKGRARTSGGYQWRYAECT